MDLIIEWVDYINNLLWNYFLIFFLIFTSLFYTIILRFIQVRNFSYSLHDLKREKTSSFGISGFQALCTSLASRVGTGNIAGVSIALYMGGPGAVFWMWVLAFLGMATSFAECSLAQLYKFKSTSDVYRGGPSYYMFYGLKKPLMAYIFSVVLIITYAIAFNSAQSHTIAEAFYHSFNWPHYLSGIFMCVISAGVILGGIKRISVFSQWMVPFMSVSYILGSIVVIALNYHLIPTVFLSIFKSAFGFAQAGAGVTGFTVMNAMTYGAKRGLFSNEAGMGSVPNIAAAASSDHPATQGYMQMLGPFVDTIVICSCTAFIILFSGVLVPGSGITGVELTQKALVSQMGSFGSYFLAFILFWFVFTTIIGNYSYAEMSLYFLFPKLNKSQLVFFRMVVLAVVALSPLQQISLVWNMADLTMGVMTTLNLVAILLLAKEVLVLEKDYNSFLKDDRKKKFSLASYPAIAKKISSPIWKD